VKGKRFFFHSSKNRKIRVWTKEEDARLLEIGKEYDFKNWKEIAKFLKDRTAIQCSARYKRIRPGLVKGIWSVEEDITLMDLIKRFGKNWSQIAKYMPSRNGKQIRDRYLNILDPSINKDKFTKEEDNKLIQLYSRFGTSWSKIVEYFPGRTCDMIKNRFYSSLRKKINYLDIKQLKSLQIENMSSYNSNNSTNINNNIYFLDKNEYPQKNNSESRLNYEELKEKQENSFFNNILTVKSNGSNNSNTNTINNNMMLLELNCENLSNIQEYNNNNIKKEATTIQIKENSNSENSNETIDYQLSDLFSTFIQNTSQKKINQKIDFEKQLDLLMKMLSYTYMKIEKFNNPNDSQVLKKLYETISTLQMNERDKID